MLPLVHVIDADLWFNFATDYLEAHLRRLEIVDMPIEQLEFYGIFDVKKAEDYCDGVGLGKALGDFDERWLMSDLDFIWLLVKARW